MSKFIRIRDYVLYTSTSSTIVQSVYIHDHDTADIIFMDGRSFKYDINTILKPSVGNDITAVVNQAIADIAIAV